MSRTVGRLLAVGAAIAVNFIPGVGQALSATIGSALASSVSLAVTAYGIQSGIGLLGFGPKTQPPEQTNQSIKSPRPARVYANGVRRLWGAYLLYETAPNGNTVDVWAFTDSRLNTLIQLYMNDDKVGLSNGVVTYSGDERYGKGVMPFGYNRGLPTETAFAPVIAQVPTLWTTAHRGDGVVTAYLIKKVVSDKNYLKSYPQGDRIEASMAATWGLHFDPRNPAHNPYNPETWSFSENAASHFISYLITKRGLDWNTQGEPRRAQIVAAYNVCDEAVPLAEGGTEPRYRGCVTYKATDDPAAIQAEMLAAFDGWYCYDDNDQLVLYAGKYYAPTVTLDARHISSYRDAGGTIAEDAVNEIRVSYISAQHEYAQVEAQPWRDEAAIAASGREPNSTSLDIQSPSYSQNRRLAKRAMAKANPAERFTISTTYGGNIALGQRYVNVNIQEGSYQGYSGPVEITSSPEIDMTTGGLVFECISIDPNIDAWNPATEQGEGAPVGDRIIRQPVPTPVILNATPQLTGNGDGALVITDVQPPELENGQWTAGWKLSSSTSWADQEYADIDDTAAVRLEVGLVPLNESVDVSVIWRHPDGRYSERSNTQSVDTTTANLPPNSPSGFSVSGGEGQAYATWTNPSSVGYADTQLFRADEPDFSESTLIATVPGAQGSIDGYTDTVAAGTYYYFVTARNGSGISSPPVASPAVTVV